MKFILYIAHELRKREHKRCGFVIENRSVQLYILDAYNFFDQQYVNPLSAK